jgi:hypothetical protein
MLALPALCRYMHSFATLTSTRRSGGCQGDILLCEPRSSSACELLDSKVQPSLTLRKPRRSCTIPSLGRRRSVRRSGLRRRERERERAVHMARSAHAAQRMLRLARCRCRCTSLLRSPSLSSSSSSSPLPPARLPLPPAAQLSRRSHFSVHACALRLWPPLRQAERRCPTLLPHAAAPLSAGLVSTRRISALSSRALLVRCARGPVPHTRAATQRSNLSCAP